MRIQTPSLESEQTIWLNVKAGSITALKDLYELYYPVLYNYGKKMVGDVPLITDAIQETFISIWKYRNSSSVPPSIRHYMLKAFRNELVRQMKLHTKTTNEDESFDFSFSISVDQQLIDAEEAKTLSATLNAAVAKLSPRQRELIYYRFYEGLSFHEIASLMNMQTRATYKLTARAIAALRELLGGKEK